MNTQELKQKIVNGQISDVELSKLLPKSGSRKSSFFKDLLKGFIEGYTIPNLWKIALESLLILVILIGAITLSFAGKMDNTTTAVLLSAVLGFLFGKIRSNK
jgi:hypothetical protein